MKHLHRSKAIENYKGARLAIKEDLTYPSYMMLKESLRATLAYINEDIHNMQYSTKTSLKKLLQQTPFELLEKADAEVFNKMLELEKGGLEHILSTEMTEFKKIKKPLKKMISVYLKENL